MNRFPINNHGGTFEIPPRLTSRPCERLSTPAMPHQERAVGRVLVDFLFPVAVALAFVLAFVSM